MPERGSVAPDVDALRAAFDEPALYEDKFYQVQTSSPAWLNLPAIERDWPSLAGMADPNAIGAAAAFFNGFGLISEAQLAGDQANEPIVRGDGPRIGFRLPRYGRAAILWVESGGGAALVDVKGCGVPAGTSPRARWHETGLLPLREAFREIILQGIIDRIFESLGVPVRGVPVYALLNLGFDGRISDGGTEPVGTLVRKAHRRPRDNLEVHDIASDQHRMKLFVEFTLRKFGVTSCNPIGRFRIFHEPDGGLCSSLGKARLENMPAGELSLLAEQERLAVPGEYDAINVQLTRDCDYASRRAAIVDFGHYCVGGPRYDRAICHIVADRRWNWGGLIDEDDVLWTQPDPELAAGILPLGPCPVPRALFEECGIKVPAETTRLTVLAMQLALDVSKGAIRLQQCNDVVGEIVSAATDGLPDSRPDLDFTSEICP